jgi:hypothetical protein
MVLVVGLAAALSVVLVSRTASAQEVALQSSGSSGPDPFTGSVSQSTASASPSVPPSVAASPASGRLVQGSTVGLYGGTEQQSSCNVGQLSDFLVSHPDKGRAWAAVEGIPQDQIPAYLRSLTPVVLRTDTRVTNHGFRQGAATSFQSVLQAGTAVLVDSHGVPRARCACGNPLLAPLSSDAGERYTGAAWAAFRPENVVTVTPAVEQITVIVLVDPATGTWFQRPAGSTGSSDTTTTPPPSAPTASSGPTSSSTAPSSGSCGPSPGSPTSATATPGCSSSGTSSGSSSSPPTSTAPSSGPSSAPSSASTSSAPSSSSSAPAPLISPSPPGSSS